jgi:PilZ domain
MMDVVCARRHSLPMGQTITGLAKPRVPCDVEGTAFIGNDTIRCRIVEVGVDGIKLVSPMCRAAGEFARIQFTLEGGLWIDLDAVFSDCERAGGEWRCRLAFVGIDKVHAAALNAFVAQQRAKRPVSSPVSSPAPVSNSAPPSSPTSTIPPMQTGVRVRQKAVEDRVLRDLYREALKDLASNKGKGR